MLDIKEFRKMQKEYAPENILENEIEKNIDSFLIDCAKNNKTNCYVINDYDNQKCIKFYYEYRDYENEPDEIITFSKNLKSIVYYDNIKKIFKKLVDKYKEGGYNIKYSELKSVQGLSFYLNED